MSSVTDDLSLHVSPGELAEERAQEERDEAQAPQFWCWHFDYPVTQCRRCDEWDALKAAEEAEAAAEEAAVAAFRARQVRGGEHKCVACGDLTTEPGACGSCEREPIR